VVDVGEKKWQLIRDPHIQTFFFFFSLRFSSQRSKQNREAPAEKSVECTSSEASVVGPPSRPLFSSSSVRVLSLSLSLSLELYFYLFIRVEKLALRAKRVMMMAQSVAHKLFSDGWKKNQLNQLEFPVRSFIDAHFFWFFCVALTAPSFPAK
jgi:hypothetical protein